MLCFVGFRLPPGLRQALVRITNSIEGEGWQPMDPEMMHCTVAFYGKMSHQRKVEIRKVIAELPAPAGSIIVTGLDQFPERKRNLVVARLSVPTEWKQIRDTLVERTEAASEEEWAPHVTLGKLRYPERFSCPPLARLEFDNVRLGLQLYG